MFFQIESVFEKYNLEDGLISKGRQVLLCEKEHKLYALKEYQGTEKKADFLYRLGEYLGQQGVLTDALIKNKDGELFSEGIDGTLYTLHRWYRGRECDIRNRLEVLMAVSNLAHLHQVCKRFPGQQEDFTRGENPLEEYLRHTRELKKIYQFISRRKKKSEFELLYLNCFGDFFSQCQEICDQMQRQQSELAQTQHYICHGDFNYHNVIFVMGKPVFLQFSKAGYGIQIFDFCNFMRKIMEKYGWDEALGIAMIEEYHRVNPLDEHTFWHMYYRMAYPEKFWKLANRYYVSNKAWIAPQSYEKLKREIRQNTNRKRYLERMLYFYENMDRKS